VRLVSTQFFGTQLLAFLAAILLVAPAAAQNKYLAPRQSGLRFAAGYTQPSVTVQDDGFFGDRDEFEAKGASLGLAFSYRGTVCLGLQFARLALKNESGDLRRLQLRR
jgi:opacity protein-like surface antigen